ncbi:MAG: CinA family protein [Propionibacteriaceae bacterium]|jgi:nicotinamide-nucleotide amidase|nr:CinA family protein [Propionibacteriaceae bacterium]
MTLSSQIDHLAGLIISRLTALGQTLATCESLTGGLIVASLVDVPGASLVVRGGLVTYATDLKTRLAGVPAQMIADETVVSQAVAEAMAIGCQRACLADWGIGVTGVAGPGPTDGVPAGSCWLTVAGPHQLNSRLLELPGDRSAVRWGVVEAALTAIAASCEVAAPDSDRLPQVAVPPLIKRRGVKPAWVEPVD